MKKFQITLVLLALIACASQAPRAQELVLETEIVWKKKNKVLLPEAPIFKDQDSIPFLSVSFRNTTKKDIYFPKPVIVDSWQLPRINGSLDVNDRFESISKYESLQALYNNYNQKPFNVYFQGMDEYSGGLMLLESDSTEEETEYPIINSELEVFYEVLQTQLKLDHYNSGKQLHFFSATQKQPISYKEAKEFLRTMELTPEPILQFTELSTKTFNIENNEAQFVFLKAGERYEMQLNLIGFKLFRASYEFELPIKELKGIVYGAAEWDQTKKRWIRKELVLPPKIGKYNLYKGKISANKTVFTK